jgi:hypothetical protein
MSVAHHRPQAVLAVGQVWRAAGQPDHVLLVLYPQTGVANAAVKVSTPYPADRVVTMSVRSLRSWISRHQAELVGNT